jgi:FtsP/CotA-like multicopper oxidase with cupredoxin domain
MRFDRFNTLAGFSLFMLAACVSAQTASSTRQTAQLPAKASARQAPQLTALRAETPGPCPYQTIDVNNPAIAGMPFQNPPEYRAKDGTLQHDLIVKFTDPTQVKLANCGLTIRSFNGQLVGPTLRMLPGDTIKLLLKNQLPTETAAEIQAQFNDQNNVAHIITKPHSYNTTNLHFHGLHVSPSSKVVDGKIVASDDVLIAVPPKTDQQYEVVLPKDHPAGTFWYHPHAHGSTAIQVGSGMAGALIIDDEPGTLPPSLAAASSPEHEKIMVFQSILYDTNGQVTTIASFFPSPSPATPNNCKGSEGTWDCSRRMTTINGQIIPIIHMRPGEVQRWRMVDASFRESIELQLDDTPLNEIALDGIYMDHIDIWNVDTNPLDLEPGYRSDVLVQAKPCTGSQGLRNGQFSLLMNAVRMPKVAAMPPPGSCVYGLWNRAAAPSQSLRGGQQRENLLAIVEVDGPPVTDMSLPTATEMAAVRKNVNLPVGSIQPQVTGVQQVTFKLGQDPAGAKNYFQVNYGAFDPDNVRRLLLNATEQWNITTVGDPTNFNGIPPLPHVFHIHVNPFQYSRSDPGGKSEWVWKDTLLIPPGNGNNSINVYTTYKDFTGQFVMHCHILDHEDLGMMEVDEVVKDLITPMKMETMEMMMQHSAP